MCRRAVNRALSTAVKTPAGLRILCPNPPTLKTRTTLKQRAIRIKNARCTIPGRHSQCSSRDSSNEYIAFSPYAHLPKGFQGVLVAHAA
jgi:hypothetical protein